MGGHSKILFFILMLFMSTVYLISYFQNRQVEPLHGTSTKVEKPIFSWTDWLNGDFQTKMDKRTNSHFFIRSVLIKVRNQIDYTFFDKVNSKNVLKGKDNVLYEQGYIDSYLGMNFIGEDKINEKLDKIKRLQDTLTSMDKKLLVVIASSKAAYFPNNFPAKYDTITKQRTNYEYFEKQIGAKGINHIDFNKLILDMQDTIAHPSFSKKGIHWSNSSKQLVWNTIAKKLEEDKDWKLARLQSKGFAMLPPKGRDRDLFDLLNIYGYRDDAKMAYHDYHIDTVDIDKPLGLVIGDSFFWGLRILGFSREVLNDGQFWFYNNSVYPEDNGILYTNKDFDLRTTALKNDIIILLTNPSNLHNFPFGFDGELLEALLNPPSPKVIRDKEVGRMMKRIRKKEEWFSKLTKESLQTGVNIDTLLYRDAEYFLIQEGKLEE